jgi:hypothetical protein
MRFFVQFRVSLSGTRKANMVRCREKIVIFLVLKSQWRVCGACNFLNREKFLRLFLKINNNLRDHHQGPLPGRYRSVGAFHLKGEMGHEIFC